MIKLKLLCKKAHNWNHETYIQFNINLLSSTTKNKFRRNEISFIFSQILFYFPNFVFSVLIFLDSILMV